MKVASCSTQSSVTIDIGVVHCAEGREQKEEKKEKA